MHVAAVLRSLRYRLDPLLLLFGCLLVAPAAQAQERPAEPESWLRPLVFVGPTTGYFFDDAERDAGLSGRIGVRLPLMDVSLVGEHWGDWGGFRFTSALVEANLYPFGTGRVAPFALVGVGYVRYRSLMGESSSRGAANGIFGLGVQAALWHGTALRTEAAVRNDAGAFSGQLRLGLGYAADAPRPDGFLPAWRREFALSWMAPVRGPWKFVDPGFGVRFARPVNEYFASAVGIDIYHWQIPGSGPMRNYAWDTRALVGTPGVEWRPGASERLTLRAGPAIVAMGEGPDAGINLGLHAAGRSIFRPVGLPVSAGVGLLWFIRGGEPDAEVDAGTDQLGLMLFGSLQL